MLKCLVSENGRLFLVHNLRSNVIIEPHLQGWWRLVGIDGVWEVGKGVRASNHPENRELVEGVIFVFNSDDPKQCTAADRLLAEPAEAAR